MNQYLALNTNIYLVGLLISDHLSCDIPIPTSFSASTLESRSLELITTETT